MCHPPIDLTPRELDVLRLLVDGLSNQQIADRLGLSRRTVHAHVASAMGRTEPRSRYFGQLTDRPYSAILSVRDERYTSARADMGGADGS
jgi:DNA-binding CsgD family transcriptional regulator